MIRRIDEATYAKETLLSRTLKQKTTASGSTCFATWGSNSKKPPPAIPPEPLVIHLAILKTVERGLVAFLKPPVPIGATGKAGAIAAPRPRRRSGLASPRVRVEKAMRSMWVRRS